MSNFIYGVRAVFASLSLVLKGVTRYQLLWGFAAGFVVSTLMHGFLISDHPKQLPALLLKNKVASFQHLNSLEGEHAYYNVSYSKHSLIVDKVKFVFGSSFCLFFVAIIIALVSF